MPRSIIDDLTWEDVGLFVACIFLLIVVTAIFYVVVSVPFFVLWLDPPWC